MAQKNFWTLFKKEFYYNYLISPVGAIFAVLFFLISGWLFFQDFFLIGQTSLDPLFSILPLLFLFFLPALTMNLFSEEKRNKTWEVLLTLPVSEKTVVLAKFLSSFTFAAAAAALTFPFLVTLKILGSPDWGIIISAFLGIFLLQAAFLSLGIFFSSLSSNPVVAFVTSVFSLLVLFFLGEEMVLSRLPPILANIASYLSPVFHFQTFTQGYIGVSDIIFFLSWIFVFLWLTIVSLKSRNY